MPATSQCTSKAIVIDCDQAEDLGRAFAYISGVLAGLRDSGMVSEAVAVGAIHAGLDLLAATCDEAGFAFHQQALPAGVRNSLASYRLLHRDRSNGPAAATPEH